MSPASTPIVCVLGDCTLDVTVVPQGGVVAGGDRRAAIALSPGGQGANVAVRLARRGCRVRLVAAFSSDLAGAWLRERLAVEHVEVAAVDAARSSVVIAILDARGERTMLSDRVALRAGRRVLARAVKGAGWIHCSGYLLRDAGEASEIVAGIRSPGSMARLSVAGGSFSDAAEASRARRSLAALAPDLVVMGLDEARWMVGSPGASPERAVEELRGGSAVAVVTAGGQGSVGSTAAGPITVPAEVAPHGVLDATGAGDAYVAALIAALAGRPWPPPASTLRRAMTAASRAGARAAGVPGAQGRIRGEQRAATVAGR